MQPLKKYKVVHGPLKWYFQDTVCGTIETLWFFLAPRNWACVKHMREETRMAQTKGRATTVQSKGPASCQKEYQTVRLWEEMRDNTKSRTIKDDKRGRKKCIGQCKGDTVNDIIKIRLHVWDLKKNYMKEEEHPLCASERDDDTTEHVLQYGRDEDGKQGNTKDNTEEEWEEVVQMFT